jgi:hypothetical protein
MKRELLICTLCLLPIAAHAEWDTQTLLNNYNAGTLAEKFFIAGILSSVENGMSWADAELINSQHAAPLYCTPSKLDLTGEQILDMLRRHVQDQPSDARYPYGLVMMQVLKKVFPCH